MDGDVRSGRVNHPMEIAMSGFGAIGASHKDMGAVGIER